MIKKRLVTLMLLLTSLITAKAQIWEVGVNAGGAGYMGDLNQVHPVKISGINAGVYVKKNIDGYFGLLFNYNFGNIKGFDAHSSNAYFRDRNLSFNTALHEASLQVEFNFLEYMRGVGRMRYSPFIFAGGGVVYFRPTAKMGGDRYYLPSYTTEGQNTAYKTLVATIPFGVGFRYNLDENFSIVTKAGYRAPFTDYLDDVSNRYPDPAVTPLTPASLALSDRSGEQTGVYLGRPGLQRGDFRKRDTYMFVGIGISYTFVSSKCFY